VVADALSRTGVPRTGMPLIADLDRMGITFCYASIAHEETKMLIQSSLRERVREAQLHDRLLQEVCKRIEAGSSPDDSSNRKLTPMSISGKHIPLTEFPYSFANL
jgi:hypothetical protein